MDIFQRLYQVLANLLVNARTHTPEGTAVTVRVGTTPDAAIVEVADADRPDRRPTSWSVDTQRPTAAMTRYAVPHVSVVSVVYEAGSSRCLGCHRMT